MRFLEGAWRNRGSSALGSSPLGPVRARICMVLESGRPMRTALSPPRVAVVLILLSLLLLLVPSPTPVTVSPVMLRRRPFVVPPSTTPSVVRPRTAPCGPCGPLSGGGVPLGISARLPSTLVVRRSPWVLASNVRPSVHISVNWKQDQLHTRTRDKGGGGVAQPSPVRFIDVNALLLSSSWKRAFCFLFFALLGIACPMA